MQRSFEATWILVMSSLKLDLMQSSIFSKGIVNHIAFCFFYENDHQSRIAAALLG